MAIKEIIDHNLSPFIVGKSALDIRAIYEEMQWHIHYVVRGGIVSFAISAGRWGKPEDFAGPVVFLASAASNYVNDTILNVDGGWMGR